MSAKKNKTSAVKKYGWNSEQAFYWVDKPKVDYIFIDEAFRGKGLAEFLYTSMAQWLATEKSLVLYASENQQVSAKRVWEKMALSLPVKNEPETQRIFLDFR